MQLAPPTLYPIRIDSPLILSVPHSGRVVGQDLARLAHGGAPALLGLSDPFVDELVGGLVERGHGAVVAQAPRAAIDVNRAAHERDPDVHEGAPPAPASSRARLGLGLTIARTAPGRPLWKRKIDDSLFAQWMQSAWDPYHALLAGLVEEALARFGTCLLLDCHSMPPLARGSARIVLGDRHGSTAAPWVRAVAAGACHDRGFEPAFNSPYAGGEIVRAHADPSRGIHALQVEIDRSLYLDRTLRVAGPGMGRGRALMETIAAKLDVAARAEGFRIAAE